MRITADVNAYVTVMGLFVVSLYIVAIVFAKMTIASGQSSFYGQVVNVCPTDRRIARSQIANLKTLTSTFTPNSYVAVPVRSEIECIAFCGRQEDLCMTAFWEEASGLCYLANASLHNMSPQSNEAFRIQSHSNALGKKMVVLEPQLLNKYNTDTSNECTSKSCAAGSHVCRKDCDNNMGICVVELRECDEIPVSNIRHWYIPNHRYSPNTGAAMEVTYKKQYSYTGLRVQFRGTLRASYKEVGCTRWYYHFNGQECQNPGPIEIVWYRATSVNFYRPSRVDGICEGLPAGDITVQFRVGECPGYTVTDSATGWGSGAGISLTIEENDLRHSSDTNLWTYGGNAGGDPCVLPFVYNGKSYSSCTDDSHNQLWCATTASYDADGMWGQCPGTCPGLSRFNIRQYSWTGVKGEDNALLYTFNYYKRDPSTSIHVIFIANTRLSGHGTIRYKIKFNGNDCSSPGAIDGLLAHLNDPPLDTSYDGTNAISGMCDNIGSGAISITVHVSTEPRTGTAPNAYTGWKSRSRMIVEEIRYDLDISAVMSSNGVVHRLPEHNIHQWWWWAKNDPDDVGHISFINVNYVKQSSLSYLRVYYQGALRQAQSSQTNGAGCSKWYFTFNGDKCSDPGTIAGVVYQIIFYTNNVVNDNHHRVSVLEGLCKLDAGTYNIKMYVETCGPQNNAYTCWNSSCRLVVEEVFLADW